MENRWIKCSLWAKYTKKTLTIIKVNIGFGFRLKKDEIFFGIRNIKMMKIPNPNPIV